MSLVTFTVSRIAAETVRIDLVDRVAEMVDIVDPRFRYAFRESGCAVECSADMAACLCEAFAIRVRDPRSADTEAVVECAKAVKTVLDALGPQSEAASN